ncbi:MAG: polyhydroxybutyrate depolymerase [Pseudoruegeria sp.]
MLIRSLIFLCLAAPVHAQQTLSYSVLPGEPCHGRNVPCELDDRTYNVKEPDGWDGVSSLPVMLHFHGWGRTGSVPVYHSRISGETRKRGVLLVAPTGRNRTWSFRSDQSADVSYANDVLDDVAARYPIDRDRIYVSGYSFGSAMAWRYVCDSGNGIAALLAVAGTLNQTQTCPEGPQEVRHVHGKSDTVMDFPMGAGGDTLYPVALWRSQFSCDLEHEVTQWAATDDIAFERHDWTNCASGKRTVLDLHPGGHFIPRGWFGAQLDDLLSDNSER